MFARCASQGLFRSVIRRPIFIRKLATDATVAAPKAKNAGIGKRLVQGVVVVGIVAYGSAVVIGDPLPRVPEKRAYHWISPEAEELIARNYQRHAVLSDSDKDFQKELTVAEMRELNGPLEELGEGPAVHFEPVSVMDTCAYTLMSGLEKLMGLFFREKYDHHACTLETLAAVPGIVAAANRHLRSLRTMDTDHGWINPLQEEAENERMHLLIWMEVTQPTWIERQFVIFSQGLYLMAYSGLYAVSPQTAHRLVGYLEEAAFAAYTEYNESLKTGALANRPAPLLARHYYRLPEEATLRDVVLRVRADECMHRDFNHELAEMHRNGLSGVSPNFMTYEQGKKKMPPGPWWRTDTGSLKRTWSDQAVQPPYLPPPGSASA